jgi:hypothetical protein
VWRNVSGGFNSSSGQQVNQTLTIKNGNFFGNGSDNVHFSTDPYQQVWDTCTFNGDTTFSTSNGFNFASAVPAACVINLFSCVFSAVSGIKTKCNTDIVFNNSSPMIYADNCTLNGTNPYFTINTIPTGPFLKMQKYGQSSGDDRTFFANGTTTASVIKTNSSTFHTAAPSQEMQPATAVVKLQSQSILAACASGKTCTPTVYVRKNSSYNGAAPRLIVKRQDSMGVTSDTVLATFSAAADTWQAQTGTTVAASADGVFEFVVDCDGTAGSIFVDDASATTA